MATPRKPKEEHKKSGRPAIPFKDEYIGLLLEHGKNGNPFETFGAKIGISRSKLYEWTEEFPKFLDAKNIAQSMAMDWWFTKGKDNLIMPEGEKFMSAVWIFTMKAMFQLRDGSESKQADENPTGKTKDQLDTFKKEIDEVKEALAVRNLRLVR